MNKKITETKKMKDKLLNKVKKLDEILDEVELANIISEYTDIDEIRKNLVKKNKKESKINLHGFKAFSKLLRLFPENSSIYGFYSGSWWGGSNKCIFHRYLLLLDEKTPVLILFEEKYKGPEQILYLTTFFIEAYAGEGKLNINVTPGIWPGTSNISIIDSSNKAEVYKFAASGDYSSYDGRCVSDIIKPIDLANFVTKDGEDYHIQKVKTIKEGKQD